MIEYPKTDNLFARDADTHKLTTDVYKFQEFNQIGRWLITEKIDGTNVRIILDERRVIDVRGRSDRATLPSKFIEEALRPLTAKKMQDALDTITGGQLNGIVMTLFGEGYGPGIQGGIGKYYSKAKEFRMFDVITQKSDGAGGLSRPWWRPWEDVETVARITGLMTVPVLDREAKTKDIVTRVASGFTSVFARTHQDNGDESFVIAEGVVARTDPYLYDMYGHRVMFKLKTADIEKEDK